MYNYEDQNCYHECVNMITQCDVGGCLVNKCTLVSTLVAVLSHIIQRTCHLHFSPFLWSLMESVYTFLCTATLACA